MLVSLSSLSSSLPSSLSSSLPSSLPSSSLSSSSSLEFSGVDNFGARFLLLSGGGAGAAPVAACPDGFALAAGLLTGGDAASVGKS